MSMQYNDSLNQVTVDGSSSGNFIIVAYSPLVAANGGTLYLRGGIPSDGFGGGVVIAGANGAGVAAFGGGVDITAGAATGGNPGSDVNIASGAGGDSGAANSGNINLNPASATASSGGFGGSLSVTIGNGDGSGGGGGFSIIAGSGGSGLGSVGGSINYTLGNGYSSGGSYSITAGNADTDGPGGSFTFTGGNGFGPSGSNTGGGFSVILGNGGDTSSGGSVVFTAGVGGSTSGTGGSFTYTSGNATGVGNDNGGDYTITLGNGTGTGRGGDYTITLGNGGATGDGGDFNVNAGFGSVNGGILTLRAGNSDPGNTPGHINIYTGSPSGSPDPADVGVLITNNTAITAPVTMLDVIHADTADFVARLFNTGASAGSLGVRIQAGDGTAATFVQFDTSAGTNVGSITFDGVNTLYNAASDARLKKNIVGTHFTIEDLMKVKVRDFEWRETGRQSTGFIAQEIKEVYPQMVSVPQNEDLMMQVDYGKITPLLVKAIQDQQNIISKLLNDIDCLKQSVIALQNS